MNVMSAADNRTAAGVAVSELIISIFRLNGRLLVSGDRLVTSLGLTSARWQVLGAIGISPTPEPVARLARNMGLTRQSVQRIVGELLAEGFVELKDNPHHRSAKLVVMTAKGEQAYRAALRLQAPWVNMLAEGLDEQGIEAAGKLLDTLRQRLEQSPVEGGQT
jgi:DNA-binding MarR family transcriptional regulator